MNTLNRNNLSYFESRHNTELPYSFEIQGEISGPHIVIIGGTHGHEPAGVEAIVKFNQYLENNLTKLKRGKITFIIGNPEAYKNNLRFVDQNLNRSFTINLENNYEGKRALEIREFFKNNLEISGVFDLHSVSSGDFSGVAYIHSEINLKTAIAISNLSNYFSLKVEHTPGLIVSEFDDLNCPALVIECGNNSDSKTVEVAYNHILNIIKYYNLADLNEINLNSKQIPKQVPNGKCSFEDVENNENINLYHTFEAVKPGKDFKWTLDDEITTGTKVKKGQKYAEDINGPKIAGSDCILIIPDKNPKPNDHDAGFIGSMETISKSFFEL